MMILHASQELLYRNRKYYKHYTLSIKNIMSGASNALDRQLLGWRKYGYKNYDDGHEYLSSTRLYFQWMFDDIPRESQAKVNGPTT